MTDMKRTSVSLPDEMVLALDELKRSDEFKDRPYSELIRAMVQLGLEKSRKRGGKNATPDA